MSRLSYSLKAAFFSSWRSSCGKVSGVNFWDGSFIPNFSPHSDNSLRNGTCGWYSGDWDTVASSIWLVCDTGLSASLADIPPRASSCRCACCFSLWFAHRGCWDGSWDGIKCLLFAKTGSSDGVFIDAWWSKIKFGRSCGHIDSDAKQQMRYKGLIEN